MEAFKLPVSTSRAIDKNLARFIWNGDRDGRELHWKAWSTVCKSRFHGGLGMRCTEGMIEALLARLAWRMLRHPDALLSRIDAAKYCRQDDLLSVQPEKNATWGWLGVQWGRDLLKKGLKWQVANGQRIPFSANWIPNSPDLLAFYTSPSLLWDRQFWAFEASGEYTVRSGYHQACKLRSCYQAKPSTSTSSCHIPSLIWKKLWTADVPERIKLFLWRALSEACPTLQVLTRRGFSPAGLCVRCGLKEESISHMLLDCDHPRLIRRLSPMGFDFTSGTACSFADWFVHWMEQAPIDDVRSQSLFLLWEIWKDRNCHVFGEADLPPPHEIDGAFSSSSCIAGAGWVFLSPGRDVIHLGSCSFLANSPLQAEAYTCFVALSIVDSIVYPEVVIHTDCLVLV
ncbi:OLC1v1011261C1 [Oldenlandia corymbosa var. corymbosa]|uniref:OLC1v1011261C1 n=1 Tax=Oldenlandia corymbosa var. corymbosa TaxID=529605 RepID=A0AAV1DT74_OLDCO|nr:OLC1v1011261C1 [Oldenlandia corymbosa var. corymbosa]